MNHCSENGPPDPASLAVSDLALYPSGNVTRGNATVRSAYCQFSLGRYTAVTNVHVGEGENLGGREGGREGGKVSIPIYHQLLTTSSYHQL